MREMIQFWGPCPYICLRVQENVWPYRNQRWKTKKAVSVPLKLCSWQTYRFNGKKRRVNNGYKNLVFYCKRYSYTSSNACCYSVRSEEKDCSGSTQSWETTILLEWQCSCLYRSFSGTLLSPLYPLQQAHHCRYCQACSSTKQAQV